MPDLAHASQSGLTPANWSAHQLTSFLAAVSSASDERAASRLAVEHAAEALHCEVAALLRAGEVYVSIGFPSDPALERALADVAEGRAATLLAPGLGECSAMAVEVEDDTPASLVVARSTRGSFAADELDLAAGMARVLGLSLRLFRLAAQERRQRHEAETQSELNQRLLESLQQRQDMLGRLSRIQRTLAHMGGSGDVLDAICRGAVELLGDEMAGLRLMAPDDPSMLELVAVTGHGTDGMRGRAHPHRGRARGPGHGRGAARGHGGLPAQLDRPEQLPGGGYRVRHGRTGPRPGANRRQPDGCLP